MNKIFVFSFFAFSLFVVSHAAANSYFAVRGGMTEQTVKATNSLLPFERSNESNAFGSVALGYDHRFIRSEFEYTYRDSPFDDDDRKFENQSLMFNLYYDVCPSCMVTPYLGAGAGATYVKGEFKYLGKQIERNETNFTWQVGAGLSVLLSRNLRVDMGYRYVDKGILKNDDMPKLHLYGNEYYAGFRYNFY